MPESAYGHATLVTEIVNEKFEDTGTGRFYLHKQRQALRRFERDHAPGVNDVTDAQLRGMASAAAKTRSVHNIVHRPP